MKKRKQLNRSQRRIRAKSRCRRRRLAYQELQRQEAIRTERELLDYTNRLHTGLPLADTEHDEQYLNSLSDHVFGKPQPYDMLLNATLMQLNVNDPKHLNKEVRDHVVSRLGTEKPSGNFQCVVCGRIWNGSELYHDPMSTAVRWTCGDLTCGANVRKVNEKITEPKFGLEITPDNPLDETGGLNSEEGGKFIDIPQLGTTTPEQFGVGIKPTPERFSAFGEDGEYAPSYKDLEDLSADSDFRPRLEESLMDEWLGHHFCGNNEENKVIGKFIKGSFIGAGDSPFFGDVMKRMPDECDLERLPTMILPFRKYPDLELSGMADDEEIIERLRQSRFGFPPKDDHGPTFQQPAVVRVAKRPSLRKRIVGAIKRALGF